MSTIANSLNTATATFYNVEELEESVRSVGWDVDYRQLSKGGHSSEHAFLDGNDISLTSVNFKKRMQITAGGSPEGYVGFLLPRAASAEATMFGTTLTDGGLIFFPGGSEMDFVISEGVGCETILVREDKFYAITRALAPLESWSFLDATTIYQADLLRFIPTRWELFSQLRIGRLDAEAVSRLLAKLVLWTTDASPELRAEQLCNGRPAEIARRAQTFIEDNYQYEIRLEDLCSYTAVGVRSLQRCFKSYFQIGPFEYIKARRLNEARRALIAADPSDYSVTQIAMMNGISHLGRFSVEYRAYFGESPSETLVARTPIVAVRGGARNEVGTPVDEGVG